MQAPSSATTAKSLIVTPSSSSSSSSSSASAAASASAKAAKIASNRSSKDPNCEIEEISKKISEHADAIYRTWKCRGLAPTELLDFYTAAAAAETTVALAPDFFGASSRAVVPDEVTSTEGLQQLVNTFVIKDKQQRSAKSLSNKSIMSNTATKSASNKKSPILTATTTTTTNTDLMAEQVMLTKQQKQANIMKQAKPATQRPSAILLPESTTLAASAAAATTKNNTAYSAKKSPTTTTNQHSKKTRETASIASATTQRNACASDKNYQPATKELQQQQQQQHQATQKTKTGSNKFAKDIPDAVSLNLGLDLDLNNLTQLQSENLLKIKELLQQESEVVGKPKKTMLAAKTTAGTKNKRALNELASENATATSRRNGDDTLNHDKNAKIVVSSNDNIVVVVAADKNSNCTKKSPIIAANKTLTNEQQQQQQQQQLQQAANSSSNANQIQIQNKTKGEDKNIKNKVLKTSNISSISVNASNNSCNTKSNNNNNKMPKEKSVAFAKNSTSSKASVPAATIAIPSTTIAATSAPTSATTATLNASSATISTPTTPAPATSQTATENVMEVARSSMPAPTKVKTARPLTNGQDKNLGRPILTRGSVAERVLMFEKCPDVRHSFLNTKRPDPVDAPPKSLLKVKLHATPPQPSEQNSLQREIRISGKNVYIPRFYFPHGKPQPQIAIERTLRGILSAFDSFPNNQVTKDELPRILKLCGLPFYWRMPVMVFCQQGQSGLVERQRFVEFWKQMNVYCHDNASRFVYILSRGQRFRSFILQEDLAPLVQDVVDTHPGLAFLKEATEFHSRYVHTVIARIFYSVNRCWSGKISISELKKSDLLEIITLLEEEDDINQIMAFFSYEHFYVIYCKFWELDRDHDLLINQDDLARHSDHALSTRIIERIFSGCVTRSDNKKEPDDEPKMSYTDFVWFLLSEEDKRTPTAIEYWFRCMDVDGDGVLSMYELEYFYEEQQQRMESIGIETLPFEDCLCQMLDMIKPQNRDCITLGDLKRCKMTHVFFDTFFNLEKYLDHEQRDPFASQRDEYSSDWDRFAAQEYELLITEEND